MATQNPIYFKSESKEHPLVRGRYALVTPPIDELFEQLCEWIDSRVSGGYVYGPLRFGKTFAVRFWIIRLLAERYHGQLALFVFICKHHGRFSDCLLLRELLEAAGHKTRTSESRKSLMDRLVDFYAAQARDSGGDHIVLIMDESQILDGGHFKTLFDLQNELDNLEFKLTVIFVGSHEMQDQHEFLIRTDNIGLMSRFMVRSARFRGIRDAEELKLVLDGYDLLTEWPKESGISFTRYFFPQAFEEGFRIAESAPEMWKVFEQSGLKRTGHTFEVPMEFIAKTVESVFRSYTDDQITQHGLSRNDMIWAVTASGYPDYRKAMAGVLERLDSESRNFSGASPRPAGLRRGLKLVSPAR